MGVEAAAFVSELRMGMTAVTGDTRETAFFRQRISVAIQRGGAIRLPRHNAGGGSTKLTLIFDMFI